MRNLDASRTRWVKVRLGVLSVLVLAGAGTLVWRAYDLQVSSGVVLAAEAEAAQFRDVHLAPKRGTIYDRTGSELAVSVDVETIVANPRVLRAEGVEPADAARRLAPVVGVDVETLTTRLSRASAYASIARQVSPEVAEAVRVLDIPGVYFTRESDRFYPNRSLAAHILGHVNVDGEGAAGLEMSMDEHLRGDPATVPALRDAEGRVVFSDTLLDDRATLGDDVYLTIDRTIQAVAERELELSVRTFEAQAGSVVVMDPATGEILAMASYPTFDPNDPGASPPASWRFRAITDRFEPGSTVKPFTIAAALAAGVLRPTEMIDCLHGVMEVEGAARITDTHPNDALSPAGILLHSSNIGAALIGGRLGARGLYRAFRRFGFGAMTGIPLPGETAGVLSHHTRWYERDLYSIAFGQGMSVNALQLATAMGVIANGGRLVEPILVSRVVEPDGDLALEASPRVRRQVIPRATARLVADMLTAVTSEAGTGAEAAIDGYLVAGKTGTAQISDELGDYATNSGRWLSSFVGFVPAEAPRLVIAVIIHEPTIDHYGGVVAGPVFRRVGEAALRHLGVPPSGSGDALDAIARDLRERARLRSAAEIAVAATAPATDVEAEPEVAVVPVEVGEGEALVPDLDGSSARRAREACAALGLEVELEGSGSVVAQSPAAGTVVELGTRVRLVLARPSERDAPIDAWDEPVVAPADGEHAEGPRRPLGDGAPALAALPPRRREEAAR